MLSQNNSKVLILSGPAGVGKGTITKKILQKYKQKILKPVTYTTRSARKNEVQGREYHFIDQNQFLQMKQNCEFLQTVAAHGNFYGSTKKSVNQIIERGVHCLLEIHIDSGIQLKEMGRDYNFVYLLPPSIEQLKNRLQGRSNATNQSQQQIRRRLANSSAQIQKARSTEFYHKIINHEIDGTIDQIMEILNEEQIVGN